MSAATAGRFVKNRGKRLGNSTDGRVMVVPLGCFCQERAGKRPTCRQVSRDARPLSLFRDNRTGDEDMVVAHRPRARERAC